MFIAMDSPSRIISGPRRPLWLVLITAAMIWVSAVQGDEATPGEPQPLPASAAGAKATALNASSSQVNPPQEPVHADVRTSSFQDVTPGKTSLAEVKEKMGPPQSEHAAEAETVLTYQLGPFPKVEMIVVGETVDSIVVYLGEPARPQDIAAELGLNEFTPASIYGEAGEELGLVYPERGVAFSFDPEQTTAKVSQLVLSPISAEFFVLRAQDDTDLHFERRLADANYALRIAPENATALWCKARILGSAGLYRRALTACEDALLLDSKNLEFRITRAQLKAELGEHAQAKEELQTLLAEEALPVLIQARCETLLGDLLAEGPQPDYEAAMKHHLEAVELAAPLASSLKRHTRRQARELLVEAHLAVANDITRGEWTTKKETAPKWLRTARTLADKFVREDGGDESIRLLLLQRALTSYVGMKGVVDPTEVVEQALQLGENLAETAEDVYRRRQIQWMMVEALADAVRIEQMRGKTEKVQQYAQQAVDLLNALASSEETTERTDLLSGRLFFYVGSTYAIRDSDHQNAVRWYEKALPHLTRVRPSAESGDLGRHGQRFVSMGVSYWETNIQAEAIKLTEDGLEMMQVAAEAGKLDVATLAVPFGNLSAMYKAVGRSEEAEKLAAKAALLEAGTQQR